MTDRELIAVLRHYAALAGTQSPGPGLLMEVAAALESCQTKQARGSRRVVIETQGTQDVASLPAMRHDMQ